MEASAINQPHPDDKPGDDLGDFFDPPSDEELASEFEEAAAEPEQGLPTLSEEQAKAEGEAYRQEKEGLSEEEIDDAVVPEPEAKEPVEEDIPEPLKREQQLREVAEREAAEAEAEAEPEPEYESRTLDETASEGVPAEERPLPSERESMQEQPQASGESRQQERPYIVFQQVPLTERVLKALLESLPEDGAPRIAFFELERAEARSVNGAVSAAYGKHKGTLGNKCDLTAVTERGWQKRHVEVKPVTETQLAIS